MNTIFIACITVGFLFSGESTATYRVDGMMCAMNCPQKVNNSLLYQTTKCHQGPKSPQMSGNCLNQGIWRAQVLNAGGRSGAPPAPSPPARWAGLRGLRPRISPHQRSVPPLEETPLPTNPRNAPAPQFTIQIPGRDGRPGLCRFSGITIGVDWFRGLGEL